MTEKTKNPVVDPAAIAAFNQKIYEITNRIIEKAMTDTPNAMPEGGPDILRAGLGFILPGFTSAMQMGEFGIMDYQINWGMDRLPFDGVSPTNVLHTFRLVGQVAAEFLSPDHAKQVQAYVDWSVAKIESMLKT